VRPSRFNPVLTFSTKTSAPGTTAPLVSVTVPNRVPSCVCANAGAAISAANKKRNSTLLLFEREYVDVTIEAIIIHPHHLFLCSGLRVRGQRTTSISGGLPRPVRLAVLVQPIHLHLPHWSRDPELLHYGNQSRPRCRMNSSSSRRGWNAYAESPRDQLEPHILRVVGTKLPRAASRSLILPAFWLLKNFLAVAHALNQFVNEAMARAWCESSWRTRFAKRPRGSQTPTREYTGPLEIALSVASMASHMKPFSF
jgi:hypothetical protein